MASKHWASLAAVAVLFAGLSNAHAHVHFCFDGQEPAAAVHLADGLDHAHEHPAQGSDEHDDLDVDVPNQALAKQVKHDLTALEPLAGWTLAQALQAHCALSPAFDAPPRAAPPYSRPQLRAPPR
jgi:hypothetical protein